MSTQSRLLDVVLAETRALSAGIREFRLVAADGGSLPGFAPGAHIKVGIGVTASGEPADWRSYSLINLDPATDSQAPQHEYVIAVQYESQGQGGSRWMHEHLIPGTRLAIQAPVNHFPLDAGEEAVVLVGGGIGITPIISMASALKRAGRGFILHYAVRSAELAVYRDELESNFGRQLRLHCDDQPASRLDLDRLLEHCNGKQSLYVCGPGGMIHALRDKTTARGWAPEVVRFELFGRDCPAREGATQESGTFEVELRSGRVLAVPADKSLLEVLQEAGVEVIYDCRDGYCGLCTIGVLEGGVDHRDTFLSDAQRAVGRTMQACVSRSAGGRLKLDI